MQSTFSWVLVLPGPLLPYIMLLKAENLMLNLASEYVLELTYGAKSF